ncbi:hypothetical protein SLE2022_288300 [Rubroshorea leprosula]
MEKKYLDYVLVPLGIFIMVVYHVCLLYRIVNHPTSTVIGINAISRRIWVRSMMEDVTKNGVLAVQTLRNNIMASTVLASTAIMLSSLISVLMMSSYGNNGNSNGNNNGNSNGNWLAWFDLGDRSEHAFSIKFFSILVCYLVAFLLNVQSIRYYGHASILINVPFNKMSPHEHHHQLTANYVATTVNRGSYFWSLGLRVFYFSFPLVLWIFGPIPMFLCCLLLVFMLYFLDGTFERAVAVSDDIDDHEDEELRDTV